MPPAPALCRTSLHQAGLALLKTMPPLPIWHVQRICDAVTGVRADAHEWIEGLDVSMHGEEGYNFEA